MRKQHLKKVNVLGIDVCDIRPEKAVSLSVEAMHSHELDTVFFLSALGYLFCQDEEWAGALINSWQMVFPGDQHTELAVSQQTMVGDNGLGKFTDEYMKRFFARMHREYREVFAVTGQQERLDELGDYLNKLYPNITFLGIVYEGNTGGAADKVVNEINAHIPDVLLLLLPVEDQMIFLRDYAAMMNTRLCICIESLQPLIVKETGAVPSWIHALHLDALYQWLSKEEKLQRTIAGSIFKKKVNEDNTMNDEHDEQI